jgi:hypothetical protein
MADYGATERVRKFVVQQFFEPARRRGERTVSVNSGTLGKMLEERKVLPANRYPIICGALGSSKFARSHGVSLERREGPPSGQSSAVTFTFRLEPLDLAPAGRDRGSSGGGSSTPPLTSSFLGLRGILKETYRQLGGARAVHEAERESWER